MRGATPFDAALATEQDHVDGARIATLAGERLLAIRRHALDRQVGGWRLGDQGDVDANRLILDALHETHPGDAVLSEEALDTAARLSAERVWIVDPLDGTREFSEHGRHDWAVHVALWVRGTLAAGAVALPAVGLTLSTAPGGLPDPAHRPAVEGRPIRIVVSRSRPPAVAHRLRAVLGAELLPLGSAGAKAMAVVLGQADVYAHAGGQYEWDNAAPAAVAAAAGLWVSRLDGRPLEHNQPDPWSPDLLICRPELVDAVLAQL